MATLEAQLSGISTEQLQKKGSELKDIIAMKKEGASRSQIMHEFGSDPDNPQRDMLVLQKELTKRGVITEATQQAGMFSNKNITIAIVAVIVVILINRL